MKAVRDEKDNMLLDCALAARTRYLVTGDKDLLDMKKHKQVEIITVPRISIVFGLLRAAKKPELLPQPEKIRSPLSVELLDVHFS